MTLAPSDDHKRDGQGGDNKKNPSGDAVHSNLGVTEGGIGRKTTPAAEATHTRSPHRWRDTPRVG